MFGSGKITLDGFGGTAYSARHTRVTKQNALGREWTRPAGRARIRESAERPSIPGGNASGNRRPRRVPADRRLSARDTDVTTPCGQPEGLWNQPIQGAAWQEASQVVQSLPENDRSPLPPWDPWAFRELFLRAFRPLATDGLCIVTSRKRNVPNADQSHFFSLEGTGAVGAMGAGRGDGVLDSSH